MRRDAENSKIIRRFVKDALTDEEFLDLCQDDFPSVYEQFTQGQNKGSRIRLLVEQADRQRKVPKLLASIKEFNSAAYSEFAAQYDELAKAVDSFLQRQSEKSLEDRSLVTETCDVLVLAANPQDTDSLQLDYEAELIRQHLQEAASNREYVVRVEQAVRVDDLSKHLLRHRPIIVHFSGHGNPEGEIILENEQGLAHPVSPDAIANLFATIRGQTECVLLNACFSLKLADALADQVRCVIGIDKEIDDEAALKFTKGVYRGLAFGQGYYKAFEIGRNEIRLSNLPAVDSPRFVTRDMTMLDVKSGSQLEQTKVTRSFIPAGVVSQTAELISLWYGTNRKLVDPSDATKGFSGERDTQIHYGSCQVVVPKSHKTGSVGSNWLQRLKTLTDDRLKLDQKSLKALAEEKFWKDVKSNLKEHDSGERMALVFIHGFNVRFEDAALRTAQIGSDLDFPGMTAFYSWPSQGKLTLRGYTADQATIQASEPYITQFLTQFVTESGASKVHVIAHSMGNKGLIRSIQRIINQTKAQRDVSFGQILLAAPDVDTDEFCDLAIAYPSVAQRTTLYVSAKDKALATSGIIHDHPRAGFTPPITIVPGIDTVEVSNIDLTWLGHGYIGDARPLLQDIHELILDNRSPDTRFGLQEVLDEGNRYWIIRG